MSVAMAISTRECKFSAINIPPIAKALSLMKKEILNASLLIPKIQVASISLEETIRNSQFIEASALHEATALKKSARNLKLAISEMQDRMTSLEISLSGNAKIPATLSTANDIAVAFHIAVNGPLIDWPLAETVLERYSFLGTKGLNVNENMFVDSAFGEDVWNYNNFECNVAILLQGEDYWRVRKSVELLMKMVGNKCNLLVSVEIFSSLASILLQEDQVEEEELKWVYLIAKN
jgi:hypothetical protein